MFTSVKPSMDRERIEFLDALRGIAILLVILYHAYARWVNAVPYGDACSNVIFRNGWLGVELFFLISGIVIFMTLERCATAPEFLARRWLRLFPAMLVCSLFIVGSAHFLPERPEGEVHILDLISGLTFMDPVWLGRLGVNSKPLDGAYWSLFVEVKFYFVASVAYFYLGGKWSAVSVILGLFIVQVLSENGYVGGFFGGAKGWKYIAAISNALGAKHFGWFAAGAFSYEYLRTKSPLLLGLTIATLVGVLLFESGASSPSARMATLVIIVFFLGVLLSRPLQAWISTKWLMFIGYISYPLYLLHQNIVIALSVKLADLVPSFPPCLLPVPPTIAVGIIAWVIVAFLEVPFRSWLARLIVRRTGDVAA